MSCEASGRHADKMGVDATVRAKDGRISYSLKGIDRYNKLRSLAISRSRILVMLFLPEASEDWLNCTREELAIRRSAWWVRLYGAPESRNETSQTVYLPVEQHFSPEGLREIMTRLSRGEVLTYAG